MRTGVSGTNWTGKTETIRAFINSNPEVAIETVSLSSLVSECPFPMIENQTLEGSRWMIEKVSGLCKKDSGELQIFDRTPLDIFAFTLHALDRTDEKDFNILNDIVKLTDHFDIIFYLPYSNEWPVNVIPSVEKIQFAKKIDSYIKRAIEKISNNIIVLPWDLSKRQELLSEHLLGTNYT
ncbi:MAG: hypothetical protein IID32_00765 [Planctomycetes bacterium]|nr:hypothetical protein [Planctomycetota bacterium]